MRQLPPGRPQPLLAVLLRYAAVNAHRQPSTAHSTHTPLVGVTGFALLLMSVLCGPGCTSKIRVTDPPRTATEQFLLSIAAKRAVEQLSVEGMRGRRVYLDSTYFAAAEQEFVLGELRAKLMLDGVQLMPSRDGAQIVLEVRSGGVGIDRSDFLLGLPSMIVDAGAEEGLTRIPFQTPELAFLKNIYQEGVASVAFIAYWADTGEVVATSGPFVGRTMREDWWILGFGPRTVGNIPTTEQVE